MDVWWVPRKWKWVRSKRDTQTFTLVRYKLTPRRGGRRSFGGLESWHPRLTQDVNREEVGKSDFESRTTYYWTVDPSSPGPGHIIGVTRGGVSEVRSGDWKGTLTTHTRHPPSPHISDTETNHLWVSTSVSCVPVDETYSGPRRWTSYDFRVEGGDAVDTVTVTVDPVSTPLNNPLFLCVSLPEGTFQRIPFSRTPYLGVDTLLGNPSCTPVVRLLLPLKRGRPETEKAIVSEPTWSPPQISFHVGSPNRVLSTRLCMYGLPSSCPNLGVETVKPGYWRWSVEDTWLGTRSGTPTFLVILCLGTVPLSPKKTPNFDQTQTPTPTPPHPL